MLVFRGVVDTPKSKGTSGPLQIAEVFRKGCQKTLPKIWGLRKPLLGGVNSNMFYFHPENWGRCPFWRAYFSKGLVQPPTRWWIPAFLVENLWTCGSIQTVKNAEVETYSQHGKRSKQLGIVQNFLPEKSMEKSHHLFNLLQYGFIPPSGICFGCCGPRFFLQGRHLIQKTRLPLWSQICIRAWHAKDCLPPIITVSFGNVWFKETGCFCGFHRRKPVPSLRGINSHTNRLGPPKSENDDVTTTTHQ